VTLRARLTMAVGIVLTVLVLSGVAIAALVRDTHIEEIDQQLVAMATAVYAGAEAVQQVKVPLPTTATDVPYDVPYTELFVGGIKDSGDRMVTYFRPELNPEAVPLVSSADARAHVAERGGDPQPFEAPSSRGGSAFRVAAVHQPGGGYIICALPLSRIDAAYTRVVAGIVLAGAAVIFTLCLLAWWVYRLGLRPIAKLTEAADAIAGGDLGRRVESPPGGTEAGHLARAFNLMVDERQAWEDQLRRFVADASHELRTPLTTIVGVMELHRSGSLAAGPGLDNALRRADQEAQRMSTLLEDLLLLARLDQGRPLAHEPVDVGRLARDAAFDARIAHPDRRIRTDIGPCPQVEGDESRLRQVVANLVNNALSHAGDSAEVRIVVQVESGAAGERCLLEVSDDGRGMSAEQAKHVFERFYRVDAARARKHGGSGLGLSIVRSIVSAHGGNVTLTTEPGEGATFRVSLPVERGHLQETSRGSRPAVEAEGQPSRHVLAPDEGRTTEAAGAAGQGLPT
jgi:two-component system OmpR family sensor kinase